MNKFTFLSTIAVFVVMLLSTGASFAYEYEEGSIDLGSSEVEDSSINADPLQFASENLGIVNAVTAPALPKEDVQFTIFEDENGFLVALYELTGKSKQYVQMGSFAGTQSFNDDDDKGKTCKGKFACGRLVFACLQDGRQALVSNGPCPSASNEYCVTCL
ncbi:MAG: hypothetical protein L3J24_14030 [Xanthomonadales bacterium]|nr:hypothetical protein [Xanthomonadales bacterium]